MVLPMMRYHVIFRLMRELERPRLFRSTMFQRPRSHPRTYIYPGPMVKYISSTSRDKVTSERSRKIENQGQRQSTTLHTSIAASDEAVSVISDTEEAKSTASSAKPFSSIPGPRGVYSIPYIGFTFLFKPFSKHTVYSLDKLVEDLHETYGPIFRVRLGAEWFVMLDDLNDVEGVLINRDPAPNRPPFQPDAIYLKREKPTLKTLASANGEGWRRLRTPLNVKMNRPTSTTHYLHQQEVVADDLALWLYRMQDSPEKMQQLFFRFGADSNGVVAFNMRLGFLDSDASLEKKRDTDKLLDCYQFIIKAISEASFGRRFMYRFYRDSFYRKYKEARDYSLRRSGEFIGEAMQEMEKQQREGTLDMEEPNFLLSLLSEKCLTMTDVLMVSNGLIIAGADATGRAIQMLFYCLAINPDKQDKLAQEILEHIGPEGRLTQQALAKMSYIKAAVNESLRLFFPLPTGTTRKLSTDIVVSGYHVPSGTTIQISSNRIARSPRYFDQPDRYIPERWLRGEGGQRERTIHTLAFLPFGYGPRKCIGRRFAEQLLYLASAKVVQKYKIGIQDNYDPMETVYLPFCSPERPIPFTFTPRHCRDAQTR